VKVLFQWNDLKSEAKLANVLKQIKVKKRSWLKKIKKHKRSAIGL